MALTKQEIEANKMALLEEKVERRLLLQQKNPSLTKSEANAIVEKEMVVEAREKSGEVPITQEMRQALRDAGLTVSGEAYNSLNVMLVPGSTKTNMLGKDGWVSKAAVKTRLMETIQTCYKVAGVLDISFAPEQE